VSERRRSRPTKVGDILSGVLKSAGLADRLGQAAVVAAWPALVGERIAGAAVPEAVAADGTLFVRVKSSAWRQELSLMTPEVLSLLNADRPAGRIKRIRWLLGGESRESVARYGGRGRTKR
jgi:predicted nucleic acid-binding Zn ribbon protein